MNASTFSIQPTTFSSPLAQEYSILGIALPLYLPVGGTLEGAASGCIGTANKITGAHKLIVQNVLEFA
eukprot:scaffold14913_cov183-Skeletonema_dohrnii-CCMP3373.AAC.1